MQSLTDSLNGDDIPGFPALDQTQAARYICRALRETVDVAADWAYGERARETLVNGGDSALTPSGSEDHDPERDPVSIHIPLHRFAAILVNAAFVAESVDADGSPVLDAPPDVPEPILGAHRSPVHRADSRASRTPDPRPRVERRGSRQIVGPERRISPAAIVGVRIAVLGGAGKGRGPGVAAIRAGFVARASRGGDSAPRRGLPRRALTPRQDG